MSEKLPPYFDISRFQMFLFECVAFNGNSWILIEGKRVRKIEISLSENGKFWWEE